MRKLLWALVALIGAFALGGLALHRGESINALWIVVAAGCFYAIYKSSTFPGDFSLNISITVLCMVILGGMGNVWGVCLGGAVLSYLNYQGLEAVGNNVNNIAGTHLNVPQYTYGIFGLIIVVMMLLRPEGLIPGQRRRAELKLGVDGGSLYDASS